LNNFDALSTICQLQETNSHAYNTSFINFKIDFTSFNLCNSFATSISTTVLGLALNLLDIRDLMDPVPAGSNGDGKCRRLNAGTGRTRRDPRSLDWLPLFYPGNQYWLLSFTGLRVATCLVPLAPDH
jgi:hypothetical protein